MTRERARRHEDHVVAAAAPSRVRTEPPGLTERLTNAFGLVLLLVLATFVLISLVPWRNWGAVVITSVAALSAFVAMSTAGTRPRLATWDGRVAVLTVVLA